MSPRDPNNGPPRRRLRLGFEGLETRDLPASVGLTAASAPSESRPVASSSHVLALQESTHQGSSGQEVQAESVNGLVGKGSLQPFLNPSVIQQAVSNLYTNNPANTLGAPTSTEVRRETLTASAIGRYVVGPPTFSDRSERIYAYGKSATSNGFLKSKWQVVLYPPANPAATPDAGDPYANQVTGIAVFISQSYLQSGTALILDLNEAPGPNSDPRALPTHGTWTLDTTSAGAFTTPQGFNQGTGTFDARYVPDKHPLPGSLGSGTVVFEFQGLYNFSQLISAISKVYS